MVEDGGPIRDILKRSIICPVCIFKEKGAKRFSFSICVFQTLKSPVRKQVNEMAGILTKPELERAEKLVSEWKPQPTALTLKAMRGVSGAEELLIATKK
jgi:uncharacterized protein